MAFPSTGTEIKLPRGNWPYWIYSQIYHSVSSLYPIKANVPGYKQLLFSILLKQQQNGLKTNQTKGVHTTTGQDAALC
jgi:hypothetical protein